MTSAASINAQRVKQAELARLLGVSRQAIGELVKRGVFERATDGLIDVEMARHALANRVRPSAKTAAALAAAAVPSTATASTNETDATTTSYHVAKTLREVAEARLAQLKLSELKGELVRAADVRTAWAKRAAGLREALLQMPARLAAILAAETDQAKCHDAVQTELHSVLAQITSEDA